ncbi:elongation factor 1b [Heterostelium album PN500]|uniref:Elongation factor 1b n=1 Tax=Heterostelium pallidum (strain ATCC 26659 / Pp 5 / PN500) TaxID=670386 RepID=D3BEW0_HETP5|nr:elongation factor 1b [Heterostelium album PN500]EFA80441.1 elongation factor 1b [Heterostelium album PN500]|eukprot:XP_020432561.1 elongation factor 1b [Heterostelium album PN500]
MPSFSAELNTEAGLKALNEYLADKTFIVGFVPSSADVQALGLVGATAPCATKYPHANRWFVTVKAYTAEEFEKVAETVTIAAAAAAPAKDDDDVDLFGSDEDDEEYEKQLEERRKAALASKKPKEKVIAKSSIMMDVKPWDDTTDMGELEKAVRSIAMDGLLWGASKLVPVGYGIKKLSINLVVVDDLVSLDDLTEQIEAFEDFVQSVDITAFNKI